MIEQNTELTIGFPPLDPIINSFLYHIFHRTISGPRLDRALFMYEPMGLVLPVIIGSLESMSYMQNPGPSSRYSGIPLSFTCCVLVLGGKT